MSHFRFMTLAALVTTPALAGTVSVDYRFDDDLPSFAQENHPIVPVRVARILLPEGETLQSIKLDTAPAKTLAYTPRIAPVQQPLTPGIVVDRDVPQYVEGAPYPADWRGDAKIVRYRGHTIVEVPLYPLRVLGGGQAVSIDSARITVETKSATYDSHGVRGAARDLSEAWSRVDNAPMEKAEIVPPEEEIGYLIIGPRALIGTETDSPLEGLIRDKENRQLLVMTAALEDVSPQKDPKEIRDYIRERYRKDSVDYVLIVGDKARFPWKYVRSGVRDRSDPVPSDQYYACLDGDFSSPRDIDWACEVSVGRVGAKTREDVAAWAKKTLAVQRSAKAAGPKQVLNFGEKLDGSTLGDRVLNFLLEGSDRAPRTQGFPNAISATKLYETFRQEIPGRDFIEKLNGGDFHVVNHLGHANETYVFRTSASDLPRFKGRPAFYYSQGCYPNDPDADNWTIRAVRMPDYGPAAMISNTRYGWYAPGSRDEGSSSMLHRAFWSMRFSEGVKAIGTMNHRAKEIVVGVDTSSTMIYTALESNLIGDPELDLGI